MANPNTINDGGLKWGSRKVKFYSPGAVDGNGMTTWPTLKGIYVLEVNTPSRPGFIAKQYDEIRQPNGSFGVRDFVELSATVQFSAGQSFIDFGDAFNTLFDGSPDGNPEAFWVTGTDEPEAQGDIRKQTLRLQKIVKATPPTQYP